MPPQLYPEVKDGTSLGALFSQALFLPIGIEGQKDVVGTQAINVPLDISRPSDADTAFGPASSLSALVKFCLGRGAPQVTAVASGTTTPSLVQRQASWALLEERRDIRIRLTDSVVQADLVAFADSCEWADAVQNKQIGFMGMATATTSANLITAAGAITSKRAVLVAPGIYDADGTLRSGVYAAAAVAVEVSKNSDLGDDLDTFTLSGLTGIEKGVEGYPIFRIKSNAGTPVNDFETLLQGGVSPLRLGRNGQVQITHLRMAYVVDTVWDSLMTRLIVDQLFVDVRAYCEDNNYLRRGNTAEVRNDLKAGVENLLLERRNWVEPMMQPDGTLGYFVQVQPSSDGRQVTISYKGKVVRGISTILVDAQLTIAA